MLCYQSWHTLLGFGEDEHCSLITKIVPSIYYGSAAKVQHYFQIVPIHHWTQSATEHQIRILMFSRYSHAYHVELFLNITSANTYTWDVINCYVSLTGYEADSFAGIYIYEGTYDYFLLSSTLLEEKSIKS
jgi:hypothetical protein